MEGRLGLVLLVLSLSEADIVFRDRGPLLPRSAPSKRAAPTFNNTELECFLQQKVLHSDGNCYRIRNQGPCAADQWLVLDKDEDFVPTGQNRRRLVCKTKPCNGGGRIFWPEDGQCYRMADKATLCPHAGNELRRDSYGEGECACVKTHIRFKAEVLRGANGTIVWEGACYPLYQRGPCPSRMVLMAEYLQGFGPVGVCHNDPCNSENSREPGTWYARHAADGRCYKLNSQGPCADKKTFKPSTLTNRPQCQTSGTQSLVLLADSPMRCDGNINTLTQECRDELIVVVKSMPFATEVTGRRRPRRKAEWMERS